MIFLILPCNYHSGWGVCGTNLAREISRRSKIRYVSCQLETPPEENAVEWSYFKSCRFTDLEYLKTQTDYPVVQAVQHDLSPYLGVFSGSAKVCLTFADRKIPPANVAKALADYDVVVAGSQWCKRLLDSYGVPSQVVLQGIDPLLFNKSRSKKQFFLDDFVVFSGGKFEQRKGQDITLKAYKVLQDRHPDVKLVCAWFNSYTADPGTEALKQSKIDLSRVISLPLMSNPCLSQVYQNTDVGMFPSRCEAGTNLVMMEYMACGKPVIATVGTGQADLVGDKTGLIIRSSGACEVYENNEVVSQWEEPDPDSAIERLEWAYQNRSKLKPLAKQGASLMTQYTWGHMADNILELLANAEKR